jgi:hypothetical protein
MPSQDPNEVPSPAGLDDPDAAVLDARQPVQPVAERADGPAPAISS